MKYFLDTEFLEGVQTNSSSWFNFWIGKRSKAKPTIDLISIGIVAEDGREYYAISKDFNLKEAWNRFDLVINKKFPMGPEHLKVYWIRENVLKPIFVDLYARYREEFSSIGGKPIENLKFSYKTLKLLIGLYGLANNEIAEQIKDFCKPVDFWLTSTIVRGKHHPENIIAVGTEKYFDHRDAWKQMDKMGSPGRGLSRDIIHKLDKEVEFYAYYADYDWVVFCWLFGKMIDLPKGFPMYCRDLKQMLDEHIDLINDNRGDIDSPLVTPKSVKENHPGFPTQENEHNALDDARWNFKLYKFLKDIP